MRSEVLQYWKSVNVCETWTESLQNIVLNAHLRTLKLPHDIEKHETFWQEILYDW
jgi:hypothetical protein